MTKFNEEFPRLHIPHWSQLDTDYPLFPLDRSERKIGQAKPGRFRHRLESVHLLEHPQLKPYVQIADDRYHKGGRWIDYGIKLKEEYCKDADEVWAVLNAMMKSPFPNHIQRWASVGLALYNWFEPLTPEDYAEIAQIKGQPV
jgi:hypothetical protein